jgi:hypothetical protein
MAFYHGLKFEIGKLTGLRRLGFALERAKSTSATAQSRILRRKSSDTSPVSSSVDKVRDITL